MKANHKAFSRTKYQSKFARNLVRSLRNADSRFVRVNHDNELVELGDVITVDKVKQALRSNSYLFKSL